MKAKNFLATAIFVLLFSIFTCISFAKDDKQSSEAKVSNVSVLQRIKNAYNDFKNRKEQPKAAATAKAEEPKATTEPKATPAKKEMTKEEMIARLKKEFASSDDIFNFIQGLKAEKDKEGHITYTFNGIRIEDMSKEDLDKLLIRTHQVAVKLRTERIQQQLKTIKQTQGVQRIPTPPQPARIPSAVSSPPRPPYTTPPSSRTPTIPSTRRY
jgi:hypothetical protein